MRGFRSRAGPRCALVCPIFAYILRTISVQTMVNTFRTDSVGRRQSTDTINPWMMREQSGRRIELDLLCDLGRRSDHCENCPPNYPPREVLLVLRLKFYTKIFVL